MKKRLWLVGVIAAMFCLTFVLTGCQQKEYTPEDKTPVLTTPTIKTAGTLRVGVNTDNAPLAGESTKIVGIDVDIAAALADQFGLKVEYVKMGNDIANALSSGSVDIVMGVDSANSDTTLWKSSAYLSTGIALFAKNTGVQVPAAGSTVTIAAQNGSMSYLAATTTFGASSVKGTSDLSTAFKELSDGTVQFVAADAVIGSWAAHTKGVSAQPVALFSAPTGYSVAALASNTALVSAVNAALNTLMTDGTVSTIEKGWLGTGQNLASLPVIATAVEAAAAEESVE